MTIVSDVILLFAIWENDQKNADDFNLPLPLFDVLKKITELVRNKNHEDHKFT